MTVLGIDIGGSGIKGAPVDVEGGALARRAVPARDAAARHPRRRWRRCSPRWPGTGRGPTRWASRSPASSADGVIGTAANLHPDWVGVDAAALFTEHTGRRATVLNDADAAGVAEVAFGAGRNVHGVVLLLTFGTGIGSALFLDGVLVPNTEFGHLELNGADAELHASDRIREEQDLTGRSGPAGCRTTCTSSSACCPPT